MHRAWPMILLILGAVGPAVAQHAAPKPRAKISERLAQEIRSTLPAFDSTAERGPKPARLDVPQDESGVITLPEMLVEESKIAWRAVEERERERAQHARLKRQYLASMNKLTTLLNAWGIPFLGASVGARSEGYANSEMALLKTDGWEAVAEAVGTTDPAAAAELKEEIRLLKHGSRPPGWPPLRP